MPKATECRLDCPFVTGIDRVNWGAASNRRPSCSWKYSNARPQKPDDTSEKCSSFRTCHRLGWTTHYQAATAFRRCQNTALGETNQTSNEAICSAILSATGEAASKTMKPAAEPQGHGWTHQARQHIGSVSPRRRTAVHHNDYGLRWLRA